MLQIHELITNNKTITISWVPSHVGIKSNERADTAAKEAAGRPAEYYSVPYKDWFSIINRRTYEIWKEEWQRERRDLARVKDTPDKWKAHPKLT